MEKVCMSVQNRKRVITFCFFFFLLSMMFVIKTHAAEVEQNTMTQQANLEEKQTPGTCRVLEAAVVSAKQVELKWSEAENATGYEVYQVEGENHQYLADAEDEDTFSDAKVKPGVTRTYAVRAYREQNGTRIYGSYSDTETVKVALQKPQVKKVSAKTSKKNSISWKSVKHADGYAVYRKTKNGKWKRISWVSAETTSYTDTTAKAGTAYTYTVATYWNYQGKKVTGTYTKGASVVTLCQAPVLKSVKASYKKTIKVSWKAVSEADGYFVYRKTENGKYKKVGTVSGGDQTSFTNKKIALDKKYTYKVAAYKEVNGTKICGEKSKKALSDTAEVYLGANGMDWPCPGYTRITSRYGRRSAPTRGASSFHRGIDISADRGAAILSVASGTVIEAGYSRAMGNYVKVDHGDGLCTMYEHASKLLVKKGDKVKKGERIAKVGSTGISTGNHLHFNVIYKDAYKDPLKYL